MLGSSALFELEFLFCFDYALFGAFDNLSKGAKKAQKTCIFVQLGWMGGLFYQFIHEPIYKPIGSLCPDSVTNTRAADFNHLANPFHLLTHSSG